MESLQQPEKINLEDSLLTTLSKEEGNGLVEYIRRVFDTDNNPDQASPSMEQFMGIYDNIDPYALLINKAPNGEIIGWSGIVPTSRELLRRFLSEEIHENDIIDIAVSEAKQAIRSGKQPSDEAAYFWASFMKPEHRGKGGMLEFKKAQFQMLKDRHPTMKEFYGYAETKEGAHLLERYEERFGIKIDKPQYSIRPQDNPKSPEYLAQRQRPDELKS
jgi:hypothetical protein